MCFQTDPSAIAIFLESAILSHVIDNPAAHLHPFVLVTCAMHDIFAVHVANAVFRQMRVTIGVSDLAAAGGIAGIPIQFEVWRANGVERALALSARGRIAAGLVLQ